MVNTDPEIEALLEELQKYLKASNYRQALRVIGSHFKSLS
jgi:hypothetical protein